MKETRPVRFQRFEMNFAGPIHTGEKAHKVARSRRELAAKLGREPTDEEIAQKLGWTAREVAAVTGQFLDVFSLDRPLCSEDGAPGLGEFLEDKQASEMPKAVIQEMENTQLKESMGEILTHERHVLVRRYGLDEREPATLAELSNELGITRERVRQLQRSAEWRIRGRLVSELCRRDASRQGSATNQGTSYENAIA